MPISPYRSRPANENTAIKFRQQRWLPGQPQGLHRACCYASSLCSSHGYGLDFPLTCDTGYRHLAHIDMTRLPPPIITTASSTIVPMRTFSFLLWPFSSFVHLFFLIIHGSQHGLVRRPRGPFFIHNHLLSIFRPAFLSPSAPNPNYILLPSSDPCHRSALLSPLKLPPPITCNTSSTLRYPYLLRVQWGRLPINFQNIKFTVPILLPYLFHCTYV